METQFFAFCQMQELETVRSGEIAKAFNLSPKQERDLFYRLTHDGWIIRLRRGLYLVPRKLPPGGRWMPDEALVLAKLMDDCDGRYQLCGPNAFHFWGFDEQLPNRVYVYNNQLSGERTIGVLSFTFIKVGSSRLGASEEEMTAAGVPLIVGSKARTLMDAVYDWKRFDGIPRAYRWIQKELQKTSNLAEDLSEVCLRYGNQGTIRRIGYLLKTSGASDRLLRSLGGKLRSANSLVSFVPELPRRGPIDRDWGIVANDV
ncbi:MAG: type IV toxin-antitoxin system AbiEi family antitoxin domain-containing protein [bacterium]